MDEERRGGDGIVIGVAVLLVVGLAAGAALFVRARQARHEREAAAARAQALSAAAKPAPMSGGTLTFDRAGDWLFVATPEGRKVAPVILGLGVGRPAVGGETL